MGKLYGCFTLIVVMYLAVPAKSQVGKRCSQGEAEACIAELPDASILYTTFGMSVDGIRRYCTNQVPGVRACLQQVSLACEGQLSGALVQKFIQGADLGYVYLCSEENIEEYSEHLYCLAKNTFQTQVSVCTNLFQSGVAQAIQNNRVCAAIYQMIGCIARHVESSCDEKAARFIEKYFLYNLEIALADTLMQLGVHCTFEIATTTRPTTSAKTTTRATTTTIQVATVSTTAARMVLSTSSVAGRVSSNAPSPGLFLHYIMIITLCLLGTALSHGLQY